MSREEAVETMFGALCEMVAFDSTEDPERARAVTIHMLDAALASGFVVLRSGDLCLECGADLATESHRSGCPYSDTNEDGSPREARNGDRIREEGN